MDSLTNVLSSGLAVGFAIIWYIALAYPIYVMAKKEGLDSAWMAWVPILDLFVMLQIADMDWWYIILFLVPCVGFIVFIMMWWRICEARGRNGILSLLMIVPIANWILPYYLAFSD